MLLWRSVRYTWAVLRHKWYVLRYGFGEIPLKRLLVHDLSKFDREEFIPYRDRFYGPKTDKPSREFFAAVARHKKINDHHPEYWNFNGIPEVCLKEMCIDWFAATRAFDGKLPTVPGRWKWFLGYGREIVDRLKPDWAKEFVMNYLAKRLGELS